VDAIAVTAGPGLAGSLLVGVNAAKALAFARRKPFVGVNHLEGHIYANWLREGDDETPPPRLPALCLVVSGGHTDLVIMEDHATFRRIGRTRDDAAGEAFDKVARLLGLGFPGGPAIQRAAQGVVKPTLRLPRAWLRGSYDFSFSGLKTAVLHLMRGENGPLARVGSRPPLLPEIAAAFQEAVVDVLVAKTVRAAQEFGVQEVLLAGGVAANALLRQTLRERSPVPVRIPPIKFCTDNGAMIGACGYYYLTRGARSGLDLDVYPSLMIAASRIA
jgi:N6-L-threonylcarbamoyladenine synthase